MRLTAGFRNPYPYWTIARIRCLTSPRSHDARRVIYKTLVSKEYHKKFELTMTRSPFGGASYSSPGYSRSHDRWYASRAQSRNTSRFSYAPSANTVARKYGIAADATSPGRPGKSPSLDLDRCFFYMNIMLEVYNDIPRLFMTYFAVG